LWSGKFFAGLFSRIDQPREASLKASVSIASALLFVLAGAPASAAPVGQTGLSSPKMVTLTQAKKKSSPSCYERCMAKAKSPNAASICQRNCK